MRKRESIRDVAMVRVREATADDGDVLVEFAVAMARETEGLDLDLERVGRGVRALLADRSRGTYFVAESPAASEGDEAAGACGDGDGGEESGSAIVGCLMLTYEWSDWRAAQVRAALAARSLVRVRPGRPARLPTLQFYWIQSVYVRPGHRRQGVFRALYDHVSELSKSSPDCCGLRLYVEHDNERAQRTYVAMGMREAHYRFFEVDYVLHR